MRGRLDAPVIPFVAFFVSGTSSLIFQTIWSRLLHHVFGSSSVAISSVVSVFMGGLALGAFWFGRRADRIRRPLLLYAYAELGVALFALCVPWLVEPTGLLANINAALRERLGTGTLAFMLARFVCIVPVLIVPTTLMGATLPLLARHFVGREEGAAEVGARVGALYAVNTLGAVVGVFLAGFVLLPAIGVRATNGVAVTMNLVLALCVLLLRKRLGEGGAALPAPLNPPSAPAASAPLGEEPAAEPEAPFPAEARALAAIAFALSGFCSLLYEVVWSRALVNTIGGSVYAFALILMTFLCGIATGSAAASGLLGRPASVRRVLTCTTYALCALWPLPLGVRHGLLAWLAAGALSAGLAALVGWAVRERLRRVALLEQGDVQPEVPLPPSAGLAPFAVPLLGAVAAALLLGGRLPLLTACALFALAGLPALLLALRGRLLLLLACMQGFIALTTLVSDVWADEISLTFAAMVAPLYHSLAEHVDRVLAMMFTTAALCVLPSALGMGAMFPLCLRIWSAGGERVGRDVSVVYTGNTLGSIAGAWLPGFVLMPLLGMQATLHLGIAVNLTLCAIIAGAALAPRSRIWRPVMLVALLPLFGLLYLGSFERSPLRWNLAQMTLGVFRISLAKDVLDAETWGEPDLLYYRDGLSTTVSVERWGRHHSLKNNGKVEASNGDDMPTQIMVGSLPLLLHERGARGLDVAVIGLGSGVTVGAVLQFPVRAVTVIELERAVAEASRFFDDVNHLRYELDDYPYVRVPRLRLIDDDGRNYLASTHETFDVIVGEPSNPWLTGVADLFTADHFRIAKRALRPGGVYCEWVQLYELGPENVKILYETFASQFRYVTVFSAEDLSSDTILVGSDSPLPLDVAHLWRGFAAEGVAPELERAYLHSPFDLLARVLLADKQELLRYTQIEERFENGRWVMHAASTNHAPCSPPDCRRTPSPLNTDDNARIEFAAPRDLIGFERYRGYLQTLYAPDWPYGRLVDRLRGMGSGVQGADAYGELAISLLAHGRKREAEAVIARGGELGTGPGLDRARALYEVLGPAPGEPRLRMAPFTPDPGVSARANQRIQASQAEIADWLARGEVARAKRVLDGMPASLIRQAGPELRYVRAYLLYHTGDHASAVGELEALARTEAGFVQEHPGVYFYLARSHDALQHFDKAVRAGRAYVEASTRAAADENGAVPEPPGAPETDAPGATEKGWKQALGAPGPDLTRLAKKNLTP